MEGWFYSDASTADGLGDQPMFELWQGGQQVLLMSYSPAIERIIVRNGSSDLVLSHLVAIEKREWTHVAMSYDEGESDSDDMLVVFVGGSPRGVSMADKLTPAGDDGRLFLGTSDLEAGGWEGSIDGLRISQSSLYAPLEDFSPLPIPVVEEDTIGLWHFDGNLDNAADSSAAPLNLGEGIASYLDECP